MKIRPPCKICKKGLHPSEFKGENMIQNICLNCEYNETRNKG